MARKRKLLLQMEIGKNRAFCIDNERHIFLYSYKLTWIANVFVIVSMPKAAHNLSKCKLVMHNGLGCLNLTTILKTPVTANSYKDALSCFVFESFFAANKLVKTHEVSDWYWRCRHIDTERFFIFHLLFILKK